MEIAIALYDYQGATDEELNFSEGDVFRVINKENIDWFFVKNAENVEGYVPSTYLKLSPQKTNDS